jgi:glycosyltransferase involved in cell wall biosynthesis
VQSAVWTWIEHTPHVEHVVLSNLREGSDTGQALPRGTKSLSMPPGHLARIGAVQRAIVAFKPDVVHAHSSWAGIYCRLAKHPRNVAIVYSPHCFAFERTDLVRPIRTLLRYVESALSLRTNAYATVSNYESALISRFVRRRPSVRIPVFVGVRSSTSDRRGLIDDGKRNPKVIAVGRVSAQKSPTFFAEVARISQCRANIDFTWVGGGDALLETSLRSAGVEVTGWVEQSAAGSRMDMSDVFLHTAAWEGSPVVVEEALTRGLAVVARRIPVLVERGLTALGDSPEEVAEQLLEIVATPEAYEQAIEDTSRVATDTSLDLRRSIDLVYAKARGQQL